jgi:hypothetical protein
MFGVMVPPRLHRQFSSRGLVQQVCNIKFFWTQSQPTQKNFHVHGRQQRDNVHIICCQMVKALHSAMSESVQTDKNIHC